MASAWSRSKAQGLVQQRAVDTGVGRDWASASGGGDMHAPSPAALLSSSSPHVQLPPRVDVVWDVATASFPLTTPPENAVQSVLGVAAACGQVRSLVSVAATNKASSAATAELKRAGFLHGDQSAATGRDVSLCRCAYVAACLDQLGDSFFRLACSRCCEKRCSTVYELSRPVLSNIFYIYLFIAFVVECLFLSLFDMLALMLA